MKKNKMMRLASVLLVLCLLTTSVISGTFAKYVTTDAQYDTARVAKFGVVASLSGDLFGATYVGADDNSITTYGVNDGTVSSSVDGKDFVVAPGTENIKGLTLSITGTPEVATKVIFDNAEDESAVDYADSDIYLANGTYAYMVPYTGEVTKENVVKYYVRQDNGDYAKANAEAYTNGATVYEMMGKVVVDEEAGKYLPLTWTVDGTKNDVDATDLKTVAEVKAQLAKEFKNGDDYVTFAPNKSNELKAVVTWAWAYGDKWADVNGDRLEKSTNVDLMDTILGNMIAQANGAQGYEVVMITGNNGAWIKAMSYPTKDIDATTVQMAKANGTEVACLTAAFNARLTVEQVD